MLIEINNKAKSKIDLQLVKSVAAKFALAHKLNKSKEISIAFVGDAAIKKLNRDYRGQNRLTDILSFSGEGDLLGELIIDYAQIKRQAGQFGHSAKKELVFILAHGLLHLIGYNDKTQKARLEMIKLAEQFLKKYKF